MPATMKKLHPSHIKLNFTTIAKPIEDKMAMLDCQRSKLATGDHCGSFAPF
jgi:hypothetical protein